MTLALCLILLRISYIVDVWEPRLCGEHLRFHKNKTVSLLCSFIREPLEISGSSSDLGFSDTPFDDEVAPPLLFIPVTQ